MSQGEKNLRPRSLIRGIAGLGFPGLGQLIKGQPLTALFVLLGTVTPVLWWALIVNQMLTEQVLYPLRQRALTILDGAFLSRFGEIGGVTPELNALLLLALTIHVGAAWAASAPRDEQRAATAPEQPTVGGLP